MSRWAFGSLVAAALVAGLVFRLARLDARPMHHDEANQAVKFGALLEAGDYRYDATDHHGPTLYYLTLPAAWLRARPTVASLDEATVRVVPALFGAGLILLLVLLQRGLGRPAVVIAAALAAVSPALTYFSRFYIQEMVFAFVALGFVIAAGRYAERPSMGAAAWAGLLGGLAVATKETWLLVLPAALVACALAAVTTKGIRGAGLPVPGGDPLLRRSRLEISAHLATGLALALAVACLFYSSFFSNAAGIVDWLRSIPIYGSRGFGGGAHDEAWWYYLGLLAFSRSGGLVFTEALVLLLALAGLALALVRRGSGFWPRYLGAYAVITCLVYSAIPYKTPWNLVPFYIALVVMAGHGAARLLAVSRQRLVRGVLLLVLAAGTWHLGLQAWRANTRYAADPRNPYVYAQTTTDFLRLVQRVNQLSTMHPDGPRMLVKVIAGPYEQWPLPWYLRRMPHVGYWPRAAQAGALDEAPIVIASQENGAAVDAALDDRYVSEFYGLRPGVLLTLYVERGLWERFIERRPGR